VAAELFTLFGRIVTNAGATIAELGKVEGAATKTGASMSLGFAKANAAIQRNAGAIRAAGLAITGMGAGIAGIIAGMMRLAAQTGETAEQLRNQAAMTGLSRKQLQEYTFIAQQAGFSTEAITNASAFLQRNLMGMEQGTGNAADVMKSLGIAIHETDGSLRPMSALLPEVIAALQGMGNETQRNMFAAQVFGRGWKEIAPLLAMTTAEMARQQQAARDLGLVWSDDMFAAADRADAAFDLLHAQMQGVAVTIASAVMPVITSAMPLLRDLMTTVKALAAAAADWAKEHPGLAKGLLLAAGAVSLLMLALGPLLIVLPGLIAAWPALSAVIGAVVSPIGLVIAALAALVIAWETDFGHIREVVYTALLDISNWLLEFVNKPLRDFTTALYKLSGHRIQLAVSQWVVTLPEGTPKSEWQTWLDKQKADLDKLTQAAGAKAGGGALPGAAEDAEKAHKAAQDAFNLEEARLNLRLQEAKSEKDREAVERQIVALYRQFAGDARLTRTERTKMLTEALKLEKQITEEQFQRDEGTLQRQRTMAKTFDAEEAALKGLQVLYAKLAAALPEGSKEQIAALDEQRQAGEDLIKLEQRRGQAAQTRMAASARSWDEEKAALTESIRLKQEEAKTATDDRSAAIDAEILALRQQIWDGDEAYLRNLYEQNMARATTIAQERALTAAELARLQAQAAQPLTTEFTEEKRDAARAAALAMQQKLNDLDAEAVSLRQEYTASLRLSTAEQLASFDAEIAEQQRIIDQAKERGTHERVVEAARRSINELTKERADFLLRQELSLIEQQIAVERTGYDEKIRALQTALAAETEVTKQVELRAEIRATGTAAIQAEIDKLKESGQWQKMSLEQQARLIAQQLQGWGKIAGVALPEIQRMLTDMQLQMAVMAITAERAWGQTIETLHDNFSASFLDMTERGESLWQTFTQNLLNRFRQVIADMAADWLFGLKQMQQTGQIGGIAGGLLNPIINAVGGLLGGQGAAQGKAEGAASPTLEGSKELTPALNAFAVAAQALPGPFGQWVRVALQQVAGIALQAKSAAAEVGAAATGVATAYANSAAAGIMSMAGGQMIVAAGLMLDAAIINAGAERAGGIVGAIAGLFGGAEGAIITRPTLAMIAEAGPEKLTPLSMAPGAMALSQAPAFAGHSSEVHVHIEKGAVALSVEDLTAYNLTRLADRLTPYLGMTLGRRAAEALA